MKTKPKILFYDIETTPLLAYVWRCGDQVVRHGQLKKGMDKYNIICITYCWNDGKPSKALIWNDKVKGSPCCKQMIKDFDKLVREADLTIGKNSDSFDVKHINTQRMIHDLPGMPEWARYTDDLEKQMRKNFKLPSFSLDYFSETLGLGGKIKMEFKDWVDIVERRDEKSYTKALNKMVKYGKKDTADTRAIWNYCEKHFRPKFNYSAYLRSHVCTTCGSSNLVKNGQRIAGQSIYQEWFCKSHGGYAGRTIIKVKRDKVGG